MDKVRDEERVLVGVLKSRQDLEILERKHWYRIPVAKLPKQQFNYFALYEPARLGKASKGIRYLAHISRRREVRRIQLLPREKDHPRAQALYAQFFCDQIITLPQPIKNAPPRRVVFGFTSLRRLVRSKTILGLYQIFPAERIVADALKAAGIQALAQHHLSKREGQYCLDFAIFGKAGKIAIECDNLKAHSTKAAKRHDQKKDQVLKKNGWLVIRLTEEEIRSNLEKSLRRVKKAVRKIKAPLLRQPTLAGILDDFNDR